jgi:hypothetical protein
MAMEEESRLLLLLLQGGAQLMDKLMMQQILTHNIRVLLLLMDNIIIIILLLLVLTVLRAHMLRRVLLFLQHPVVQVQLIFSVQFRMDILPMDSLMDKSQQLTDRRIRLLKGNPSIDHRV